MTTLADLSTAEHLSALQREQEARDARERARRALREAAQWMERIERRPVPQPEGRVSK